MKERRFQQSTWLIYSRLLQKFQFPRFRFNRKDLLNMARRNLAKKLLVFPYSKSNYESEMSPPPLGQREGFFPPEYNASETNTYNKLNGFFEGIRIRIPALVLLALLPALGLMLHLAREH